MESNNFSSQLVAQEENLLRFAFKFTKCVDYAKDLVQETFLKALLNEEKYDGSSNIKPWLFAILRNIFINDYRKKVKNTVQLTEDYNEFLFSNKPASYSPESDLNFKELNFIVLSLDSAMRVPFQMFNNGYKYQEISDSLGINIGTVKSRIHFSKTRIMEKIEYVA